MFYQLVFIHKIVKKSAGFISKSELDLSHLCRIALKSPQRIQCCVYVLLIFSNSIQRSFFLFLSTGPYTMVICHCWPSSLHSTIMFNANWCIEWEMYLNWELSQPKRIPPELLLDGTHCHISNLVEMDFNIWELNCSFLVSWIAIRSIWLCTIISWSISGQRSTID